MKRPDVPKYTMPISRLTVDKLGVKLYDKVSAVLAELIANAYDADAQHVAIRAPMGRYLAVKHKGQPKDRGFEIHIKDDGAGMTPTEMQAFFLVVGAERRADPRRGPQSKRFKRTVMGRKGVGKLAPFGICKVMEVVSAGGERIQSENGEAGYRASHITLNYDEIVAVDGEPDERYEPEVGPLDETLSAKTGTAIVLRDFNFRRVSEIETLTCRRSASARSDDGERARLDAQRTRLVRRVQAGAPERRVPDHGRCARSGRLRRSPVPPAVGVAGRPRRLHPPT